jgi:putative liporotein
LEYDNLIIIALLFSKENTLNRLKKIILTVLMIFTASSCTGIGIGVGIPIGPVSVGVGTTLKVPQSKNKKIQKEIKDLDYDDLD